MMMMMNADGDDNDDYYDDYYDDGDRATVMVMIRLAQRIMYMVTG
jgi:hypothetical protein